MAALPISDGLFVSRTMNVTARSLAEKALTYLPVSTICLAWLDAWPDER